MRRSLISFLFFLLAVSMTLNAVGQTADRLPTINVKEYRLKNGLTVLMHQDASTPIVAVNVWYHVGSKNEAPGRTGFAHLFEHMMFQGSKNYTDGWSPINDLGGFVNGTTDQDRTYYFEVVPSNYLERVLYLEADRMGNLLEAITQEKLDNQRDVVKNERRLRVDNVPYGSAPARIAEIMYSGGHPYRWPVVGSMEDLSAASIDDVNSFFRKYYVPNNAILALSGDFEEKQARTWIEKYFGPIAKGADVARPNPAHQKLEGEIRKTYEEPGIPLARLYLVWHGVSTYSPDEAPLDILSNILSSGRGSRLQNSLVYGKQLAQQVFAFDGTAELGGRFEIMAMARPGKMLDELEREINAEIERIKKDPPSDEEVARAVNVREANAIFGLQTVFGKGGQMAAYAGYLNKPNYFQADLDRYRKVTAADVQRVANQYLTTNRLSMSYVPAKGSVMPSRPMNPGANTPTSTAAKKKDRDLVAKQDALLPKAGPDPKFMLPAVEKTKLSNGLNVWIVKHNELPVVSMDLVLNVGGMSELPEKSGLSQMTALMLNQGTKTRSAVDIANAFQSIGTSVFANSSWDSTSASMQTLTKNLDKALDLFSDVVVNPSFPAAEIETLRGRTLVSLTQQRSSPTAVANDAFNKVLYGSQPYGRQLGGNEKTIKPLTRDDLVNFHNAYYRPNNATLIVVGDVDTNAIRTQLEKAFAGWKPGDVQSAKTEPQIMVGKPGIYLVDKPGAPQSSVILGQVGVDRNNPDYYPLLVMNSILGGGPSARLFMNLREDKGYTYGAYSRFAYRRAAGPFSASGEIQTVSTKEAIIEFIKELNGIRGAIPVTPAELDINKQALIRRFPSGFETVGSISNQLANLAVYGLPDSYFNNYISKVNAVTIDDVNRVANKYLEPSKMAIVIVGDWKVVEPGLKELGYPITILDPDGNPIGQ